MNEKYISVAIARSITPGDNGENDALSFVTIQSILSRRRIVRLHDVLREYYAKTITVDNQTTIRAGEKQSGMGVSSSTSDTRDLSTE